MAKYTIGIDYGTLSGRAMLVNVETGEELDSAVLDYPHSVMDEKLPNGKKLGIDWALQHPQDYLDVLYTTIPEIMKKSGVSPDDVVGIGLDFTACTIFPQRKTVRLFALWINIRMSLTRTLSFGSTMPHRSRRTG